MLAASAAFLNSQSSALIGGSQSTAEYDQDSTMVLGNSTCDQKEDGNDEDDDDVCRSFIKKLNASSETRRRRLEESHFQLTKKLRALDEEEKEAKNGLCYQRERIRRRKAEEQRHSF